MVPILGENLDPNEIKYNERQTSTRSIVERLNGVLKMRFRCLLKDRTLHYRPQTASKIINACCVLHNICVEENLELITDVNEVIINDPRDDLFQNEDVNEIQSTGNPFLVAGRMMRNRIVRRLS